MRSLKSIHDEILAAAKWIAMRGGTGKVGEELPHAISDDAYMWINKNQGKFKKMVANAKIASNPFRYDPKQLKMGIKIEKEHKDLYLKIKKMCPGFTMPENEFYAMITKGHLREFKKYYTWLVKMEKDAKKHQGTHKNPQSELDLAIQKMKAWARSKAEGSTYAAQCFAYLDSIPTVIQEGPVMGISATKCLADQLAYAVANAQGWRGADAKSTKAIINKWIKSQQVQGNPYFMWEGILRNGTISEVKRKNLKKSKKASSLFDTDVYNTLDTPHA